MGLARELAQRIVALRYEDLPTAAIQGSRVGLMDTIGVLLAGANETPAKIVRQMLTLSSLQCLGMAIQRF